MMGIAQPVSDVIVIHYTSARKELAEKGEEEEKGPGPFDEAGIKDIIRNCLRDSLRGPALLI